MDNSLKGLILAAGVIITCIVVGLGFFISRESKNIADNGTNQLSAMSSEYGNVEFMMYDGLQVSGKEVINVIKKHANNLFNIYVSTKANGGSFDVYDKKDEKLPIKATNSYINPSALFLGELRRNANNELIGIQFLQQ